MYVSVHFSTLGDIMAASPWTHDTDHDPDTTLRHQTRPLPSFRATVIVLMIAVISAIGLGVYAAGDNVLPGDEAVTDTVQGMNGPFVAWLADAGNALGSTTWAAVAIGAALLIAALFRAWSDVLFLAVLLVLRLAGTLLKPIFDSPRPIPDLVEVRGVFDSTGYPSGHALTASTMALGLAVIAWRHIPSRPVAITTVGLLMLLGLLIGWARIWSGAHWASDVVGGFAFGVMIVAVSMLVLQRQSGRPDV